MPDSSEVTLGSDTWNTRSQVPWPGFNICLTLFLAVFTGVVFLSEHEFSISEVDSFVQDIEVQESWSDGGNKFRQIAFLGCAMIGMLSLLFGRTGRFRFNLPVILIGFYILWAGASAQWSIDSGTTMRRFAVVLCCVIGCFGFSRFLRVQDVVLAALLVSLAYLMLGVAVELSFGSFRPHVGGYRFAGTMHPNIQAANLAMGAIAAWVMARISPRASLIYYGIFGILFLFLISTKCRSATGAVPVALGAIWLASQPTRNVLVGILAGFWLVASVGLICMVSGFDPIGEYQEILLMGRGEETGSSLTGRIPLWHDLSTYVSRKPLQGYGFGAFWTPRHINDIAVSQEWVISEAHSSYLDTTLQLGIIGAVLMTVIIVCTLLYSASVFRVTQEPAYLYLVGGVFFCLLRGLTESGLTGSSPISAFLFLALAAHSWKADSLSSGTERTPNEQSSQVA